MGIYADQIKEYFNNFNDFKQVSSVEPINKGGQASVVSLTFINGGYNANAVLKTSLRPEDVNYNIPDSLFYEGLVGLAVNIFGKCFPCFVETYGLYKYNTYPEYPDTGNQTNSIQRMLQSGDLTPLGPKYAIDEYIVFNYPTLITVMTQHLKNALEIRNKIDDENFVKEELLYVLYQIYMPLAMLTKHFTHYDLHDENVLLYEPVKDKYIEYNYHIFDSNGTGTELKVVKFKSRYITKIIDYGRSYFNTNDIPNNPQLAYPDSNMLYTTLKCNKSQYGRCIEAGFTYLAIEGDDIPTNSYRCSRKPNVSHDLYLLYMFRQYFNDPKSEFNKKKSWLTKLTKHFNVVVQGLFSFLNKIKYGAYRQTQHNPYALVYSGTKENNRSGGKDNVINNVTDAYNELEKMVTNEQFKKLNDEAYGTLTKLGDLHIYSNWQPMEYIPAKR